MSQTSSCHNECQFVAQSLRGLVTSKTARLQQTSDLTHFSLFNPLIFKLIRKILQSQGCPVDLEPDVPTSNNVSIMDRNRQLFGLVGLLVVLCQSQSSLALGQLTDQNTPRTFQQHPQRPLHPQQLSEPQSQSVVDGSKKNKDQDRLHTDQYDTQQNKELGSQINQQTRGDFHQTSASQISQDRHILVDDCAGHGSSQQPDYDEAVVKSNDGAIRSTIQPESCDDRTLLAIDDSTSYKFHVKLPNATLFILPLLCIEMLLLAFTESTNTTTCPRKNESVLLNTNNNRQYPLQSKRYISKEYCATASSVDKALAQTFYLRLQRQ